MNRPIDNNYISKARYYELKWFCRQYHEWEKQKLNLKISPGGNFGKTISKTRNKTDKTCDISIELAGLEYKIETVDRCIKEVAPEIEPWMKKCVTEGAGYENLYGIPCSKEYFYKRYRAFFSRINRCL